VIARFARSNCQRSSAGGESASLLDMYYNTTHRQNLISYVSKYKYSRVGTIRLVYSCCVINWYYVDNPIKKLLKPKKGGFQTLLRVI